MKDTMTFARTLSVLLLLLALPACGFHPVYGTNKYTATGVEDQLSQIRIESIPDRDGQFLRNALITRFYRDGRPQNPRYSLITAPIRETIIDLDITREADATRGQIREATQIRLVDLETRDILLERRLQSVASFNILGSEFTNRVSEQNTRENALNELARQIEQQIALYLKKAQ